MAERQRPRETETDNQKVIHQTKTILLLSLPLPLKTHNPGEKNPSSTPPTTLLLKKINEIKKSSLFLQVVFACVPPASIWGGWLAFFLSLMMIGVLTTFIQDLASIFGCLVGLKDMVTAITLVALGTSLPDLFASRQAAVQERYADNSIGNVTGSNSVNVFMGLGVSWIVASIYWSAKVNYERYAILRGVD